MTWSKPEENVHGLPLPAFVVRSTQDCMEFVEKCLRELLDRPLLVHIPAVEPADVEFIATHDRHNVQQSGSYVGRVLLGPRTLTGDPERKRVAGYAAAELPQVIEIDLR